jgi:F-type H+-transporting ATPase subunit delta
VLRFDMTRKTAANRYARALFDVALKEQADLDRIDRELAQFAALMDGHATLGKVLLNPAVPAPRKRAAVLELTSRAGVSPIVGKLLVLLAERDRLVLLPELGAAYRDRVMAYRNVVRAEVTTASDLSPERARQIEQGLAGVTGQAVTVETRVDPGIIGGVVARVGSVVYDASVTRQLERMKKQLLESL